MLQTLKVSAPSHLAPREAALAKLRAIEAIRVDHKIKPRGGGQSRYVIDLYLRSALPAIVLPHSQLALHDSTTPGTLLSRDHISIRGRDPNKSVGKTYLETFAFKDELLTVALQCCCAKRCRLCQSVFEFAASLAKTPPAVVRAISTTETKRREIETLVNAFVSMIVRAQILTTAGTTTSHCESDEKIPIMIEDFLTL